MTDQEFIQRQAESQDHEGQITTVLMGFAMERGDVALLEGLMEFGAITRIESETVCQVDNDLGRALRARCPSREFKIWARALELCVSRGDTRKTAAIQELMRKRVQN